MDIFNQMLAIFNRLLPSVLGVAPAPAGWEVITAGRITLIVTASGEIREFC